MADAVTVTYGGDEFVDPRGLALDVRNPRVPDEQFDSEDAVLEYLYDHADVDELVQSILSSGWLDYEPFIVLDEGNVVLEGNRRLAALRIISSQELRDRLKIELPFEPDAKALPEFVRIRRVKRRSDARDFIGFKHINGPFKWDALAKAKYAAEWFEDGGDVNLISRRLGDNHNTVARLVNGWNVLHQALGVGFERSETTKRTFSFSHLYTALARPNVRRYLGLPDEDISQVLPANPVPADKVEHLSKLMSWLYGQRNEPSVIATQNPDLNYLVEVLGDPTALAMLDATRDLPAAYGQVEDKGLQFSRSLMLAIRQAEDALKLVGNYDGRADLMSAGDNLRRTVLSLHGAMRAAKDRADAGDARDAG